MTRMIHRNKCEGGYAVEEKDGVYCMGRVDEYIDSREPIDECKKCPRHIDKYLWGESEDKDEFSKTRRSNQQRVGTDHHRDTGLSVTLWQKPHQLA